MIHLFFEGQVLEASLTRAEAFENVYPRRAKRKS